MNAYIVVVVEEKKTASTDMGISSILRHCQRISIAQLLGCVRVICSVLSEKCCSSVIWDFFFL